MTRTNSTTPVAYALREHLATECGNDGGVIRYHGTFPSHADAMARAARIEHERGTPEIYHQSPGRRLVATPIGA